MDRRALLSCGGLALLGVPLTACGTPYDERPTERGTTQPPRYPRAGNYYWLNDSQHLTVQLLGGYYTQMQGLRVTRQVGSSVDVRVALASYRDPYPGNAIMLGISLWKIVALPRPVNAASLQVRVNGARASALTEQPPMRELPVLEGPEHERRIQRSYLATATSTNRR